ncbi:MAG TPA: hypothetical protein VGI39_37925 [Polyangiaceae bacterium]
MTEDTAVALVAPAVAVLAAAIGAACAAIAVVCAAIGRHYAVIDVECAAVPVDDFPTATDCPTCTRDGNRLLGASAALYFPAAAHFALRGRVPVD